jgi:hypothetical protein
LLKRVLYKALDSVLNPLGRLRARTYDLSKTIVIAGHPRGGTTWLAELFMSLPGHHVLWEPLHPNNNPHCVRSGFGWNSYWDRNFLCQPQLDYMRAILSGEDLSTRTLTRLSLNPLRLLWPSGYIVKFVNGNLLVPWITTNFPVRVVVMFRHPCAVVASQLTHTAWQHVRQLRPQEAVTFPEAFARDHPETVPIFQRLKSPEEVLAFVWGMQTIVPLRFNSSQVIKTSYEQLIDRPVDELQRIFAHFGKPVPSSVKRRFNRPSKSTATTSYAKLRDKPLLGWKSALTKEQVRLILNTVNDMGIDLYDDGPTPKLFFGQSEAAQ